MDVYEELFGQLPNRQHTKLDVATTLYPLIIAKISAHGVANVVVKNMGTWVSFITHPALANFTSVNTKVENGVASFTMYGVTFSYQGGKRMNETTVELDRGCKIVLQEWDTFPTSVELEYIEHSPDPWYSDTETSVPIDKEQARAIIELLTKFVNEEKK